MVGRKKQNTDFAFHLVDKYRGALIQERLQPGFYDLTGNNTIHVVRGHVRFGKSTLLKFTIANLLKSGERETLSALSRIHDIREPMS